MSHTTNSDSGIDAATAELALSVPGKTFLVGEYLALAGGPSLMLATAPRFQLFVSSQANWPPRNKGSLFNPMSPAGLYLTARARSVWNLRMAFDDPHHGRGGLGASSAQFALLYALVNGLNDLDISSFEWTPLLAEYRKMSWNGEGLAPSGADLVTQFCGGVTSFDGRRLHARRYEWSFPNLNFTLIRTGKKLATHEHLRQLDSVPVQRLRRAVGLATEAFEEKNESRLVEAVLKAADALESSGLTAPSTRGILDELRAGSGLVLAAKGCGAMGADVILAIHDRTQAASLTTWCESRGLEICGRQSDLADGFRVVPAAGS